jgi:hypothetical protein
MTHPAMMPLQNTYVSYPASGLNIYVVISCDEAALTVEKLLLALFKNYIASNVFSNNAQIPPAAPAAKQLIKASSDSYLLSTTFSPMPL